MLYLKIFSQKSTSSQFTDCIGKFSSILIHMHHSESDEVDGSIHRKYTSSPVSDSLCGFKQVALFLWLSIF